MQSLVINPVGSDWIRKDPKSLDPVQIRIRPDPKSLDPAWIRIRPDPKILDPVHPYSTVLILIYYMNITDKILPSYCR